MATRHESVRLSLIDDGFSTKMARAAAAAALLEDQLDDLDGRQVGVSRSARQVSTETDSIGTSMSKASPKVRQYTLDMALADERSARLKKSLREQAREMLDAADTWQVYGSAARDADAALTRISTSMDRNGKALDSYSGRLGILVKSLGTFGPTLAPLGAVSVAGVGALVSQLGFAAVGMTSLVVAAQGVGTAMEAVQKAELEPTVKNLQAARDALRDLDPAAQAFVHRFQEFRPVLTDLRNAAAAGWFPGLTESLDDLERVAPEVASLLQAVGEAGGNLIAEGAEALAGPEWSEFLDFFAREAPPALDAMGRAVGNVVEGIGHLVMAFDPLNDDLSAWILDGARGFNEWAAGLAETEGFAEFITYVRENGPKVADATVAIANALLQIGEAAAPLGGPILDAITGVADATAALADSPLGTPIMAAVTAISALSIASSVATKSVGKLSAALGTLGATGAAGSLGASAAKGGPWGLVLLALIANAVNAQNQFEKLEDGSQELGETLAKSFIPGFREAAALHDVFKSLTNDTTASARELRAELEYTRTVTGGGWDSSGMELFYEALGFTADEARRAAQGIDQFTRSASRAMGILDQQAAMDAFHQSIDDARKSWKEFGKGLDETKNSGRQNRAALRDIAQSALVAAEGLKGLERVNFLDNAADQIAKWAQKMGMGEKAAERFANRVLGLNNVRGAPTVDLDDKQGRRKVMQMLRDMDLLDGTRANPGVDLAIQQFLAGKISVERMLKFLNGLKANPNVGIEGNALGEAGAIRSAILGIDGMHATATITVNRVGGSLNPFSSGGYTGDGGKHEPAGIVHAGEVVIPRELVKRDWTMLKARYGHLPGFDEGGVVGPPTFATRSGNNDDADREANEAARGLKMLRAELKQTTKALEKERRQRDAIVDKMQQLESDVSDGLRSELFGEVDPWSSEFGGGTLGGAMGTIRGDLKDASAMRDAIRELKSKGLTGPALANLLAEGGLEGALAFAEESRRELRDYAQAFNRRERVLRSVGDLAGNAAYGAQLTQSRQDVRRLERRLERIESAIKAGNRDRRNEHSKDRDAQQRGARRARRAGRRD